MLCRYCKMTTSHWDKLPNHLQEQIQDDAWKMLIDERIKRFEDFDDVVFTRDGVFKKEHLPKNVSQQTDWDYKQIKEIVNFANVLYENKTSPSSFIGVSEIKNDLEEFLGYVPRMNVVVGMIIAGFSSKRQSVWCNSGQNIVEHWRFGAVLRFKKHHKLCGYWRQQKNFVNVLSLLWNENEKRKVNGEPLLLDFEFVNFKKLQEAFPPYVVQYISGSPKSLKGLISDRLPIEPQVNNLISTTHFTPSEICALRGLIKNL